MLKAHREMIKLGDKELFLLCLVVKNVSAVYITMLIDEIFKSLKNLSET